MASSLFDSSTYKQKGKYWVSPDTSRTHMAQLEFVPAHAKVLEVGSGPGHMTEAMTNKGCKVVVLEVDPEAASSCRRFCTRIIIADIEIVDLEQELQNESFDVILFGDVLEHLRNPEKVLVKLRKHLNPSGFLVASIPECCEVPGRFGAKYPIPNISHGSVRISLLQGRFEYQKWGLLDETHIKFFTWTSIRALFRVAGYSLTHLKPTHIGIFDSEIKNDLWKCLLAY